MLFLFICSLSRNLQTSYADSGVICESKYVSTSQCYTTYGTQLGSRYARSFIDCTRDCNTYSECRSILYDPVTRLCSTNSDVLTTPSGPCSSPISYWEITENTCHSVSSMTQPCTTNTECSDVVSAECRDGTCKCTVGFSYHDATKQCVSDCGQHGYGTTYQSVVGAIMMGFFNYDYRPMDAVGCKQLCLNETRFVCRTAEAYVATNGVYGCQLSWETFYTNPETYTSSAESVTYIRDCS